MAKRTNFRLMAVAVLVVLIVAGFAHGREYDGLGTAEQPFLIYTASEMNDIGNNTSDWDDHFVLMADVNLASFTGTQFNIIGTSSGSAFTGVFDGDGHTISNFSYESNNTDNIGLFGYIDDPNAEIKDLILADSNVDAGNGNHVGCLVGYLADGTVSNCHIEVGDVGGDQFVGLLVGKTYGSLSSSSARGMGNGNQCVGVLAGLSDGGTINQCYSAGSVYGGDNLGGLLGYNWFGTVTNCYSQASVDGGQVMGGLVGYHRGGIYNCYSTGNAIGDDYVGGLVGYMSAGEVVDSFWDIETSGITDSNGGEDKTTAEMQMVSTFIDAGWDFTTPIWKMSECSDYPRLEWETIKYGGGHGTSNEPYLICTAEQMNEIGVDPNDWNKHFKLTADIDMSSYSYSTAVIAPDTNNTDFPFFDGVSFTGVFDGNGHKITFLTIDDAGADNTYLGLFGRIDGGQVKNLGFESCSVSGGAGGKGGLAGINNGSITNCYFTGEINGGYVLGGLVGSNYGSLVNCYSICSITGSTDMGGLLCSNSGSVSNCYSNSTVSGTGDHIGGLVGSNYSSSIITNCHSSGSVNGRYDVGGLVGQNRYATVSDCFSNSHVAGDKYVGGLIGDNYKGLLGNAKALKSYSTGVVNGNSYTGGLVGKNNGTVNDCFWDVNSSGQTTSSGGTGKTTEEMMQEATFTNWDFIDIWKICEGTNYPKLAWQISLLGDFVCPDGVEINDLAVLVEQWLLEKLPADISPDGGNGFVDFSDWAVFANAWQSTSEPQSANWNPQCDIAPEGGDGIVDIEDLTVFVNQWLQLSAYCADIAPEPDGDGIVNMLDFAEFAGRWLWEE